jgi:hypothetical protein
MKLQSHKVCFDSQLEAISPPFFVVGCTHFNEFTGEGNYFDAPLISKI